MFTQLCANINVLILILTRVHGWLLYNLRNYRGGLSKFKKHQGPIQLWPQNIFAASIQIHVKKVLDPKLPHAAGIEIPAK